MIKKIFYLNEQGKRKNIEDNLYPLPGQAGRQDRVFMVCDGVGGESKGEEASRIVCETMGKKLVAKKKRFTTDAINLAAVAAVEQLHVFAEKYPEAQNMSTTLTLACLQNGLIWVAWCGDSRVYHLRDGQVLWKSKDHSLVQQLIDTGEIQQSEAARHPNKNIIMRSLSAASSKAPVEIHVIENAQANDYIFLCTDGMLENIAENELQQILGTNQEKQNKTALFLDYCSGKTNDNFSMYLLQLGKEIEQQKEDSHVLRNAMIVIALLGILLTTGYSFFFKKKVPPAIDGQISLPHKMINDTDFAHTNNVSLPVSQKSDSAGAKKAKSGANAKDSTTHKTVTVSVASFHDSLKQKN